MKFKNKEECLNHIYQDFTTFNSSMLTVSVMIKAISMIITAVAVVAWIIIFVLCRIHTIQWWVFIVFGSLLLTFRIAHSLSTKWIVNKAVDIVIQSIITDNISKFPEYEEMPDWMQKEFIEKEVNEIFK